MNDSASPTVLPPLDDERVAAIERGVFARIADDRRMRRRRRGRAWAAGSAAAAVVVVAAVLAPGLTSSLSTGAGGSSAVAPTDTGGSEDFAVAPADGGGSEGSAVAPEAGRDAAVSGATGSAGGAAAQAGREVISTGSARVIVDDVAEAAQAVAADAEARGGYVESLSVGQTGGGEPAVVDGTGVVPPGPIPGEPGHGWVTVRVPSDQLDAAIAQLREVGEVASSSVSRQDVTDQAIDVRARIAAGEASVARLTELMAQAADVADLIAAETALSERQAALEADRQQLAWLEGQVELATLTVDLAPRSPAVEADPAGFADGLAAGWNGLIAAVNGIVVALGFLLPWLAVIAIAAGVVWGVARLLRRIRRPRTQTEDDLT
jgi:hypothetical protein